jgi:hypothetical protein
MAKLLDLSQCSAIRIANDDIQSLIIGGEVIWNKPIEVNDE